MNLDDFIVGALRGDADAVPEATDAPDEAAALAPELAAERQLLADGSTWDAPAPATLDAVLGAIASEAGTIGAADAGSVGAPGAAGPSGGRRRSRWLTALPAAVAAAVVAVVLVVSTGSDGVEPVTVELAGTELAPEADGRVDLHDTPEGVRFELDASGLPRHDPGEFYEAWVVSDQGLVAVGTFRVRERGVEVVLWSGVELDQVRIIAVTLEADDGDTSSSGRRVLVGELRP